MRVTTMNAKRLPKLGSLRTIALMLSIALAFLMTGCKARTWSDALSPIPVTSKDPMWGSRTAPVTIVLYADFQCPFCSRLNTTLDKIRAEYTKEQVRLIWKNEPLPFHNRAKPAAEAGAGVMELKGSEAFWKFHDYAFKNQSSLTEENFVLWAKDAGVRSTTAFKDGLASHKWAGKVDTDHDEAKAAGVTGTPCAFVNGVRISGAQPYERWKTIVDDELEKANAEVRKGTPKDHVYVVMSTRNKAAEPPPSAAATPPSTFDGLDKEDTTKVYDVPVGTSPVRGNPKARVTLIVFADYQCPFCGRIESMTFQPLREKYGDKIRFVWKNEPLPFHPNAMPAANFALEARAQKGDTGFWAAHDLLFTNQQKLDAQNLEVYAGNLGLNVTKIMAAVRDQKFKAEITADMDLAKTVGATGTPTTFINGRRLSGAQPVARFETIIDEELQKTGAAPKPSGGIHLAP